MGKAHDGSPSVAQKSGLETTGMQEGGSTPPPLPSRLGRPDIRAALAKVSDSHRPCGSTPPSLPPARGSSADSEPIWAEAKRPRPQDGAPPPLPQRPRAQSAKEKQKAVDHPPRQKTKSVLQPKAPSHTPSPPDLTSRPQNRRQVEQGGTRFGHELSSLLVDNGAHNLPCLTSQADDRDFLSSAEISALVVDDSARYLPLPKHEGGDFYSSEEIFGLIGDDGARYVPLPTNDEPLPPRGQKLSLPASDLFTSMDSEGSDFEDVPSRPIPRQTTVAMTTDKNRQGPGNHGKITESSLAGQGLCRPQPRGSAIDATHRPLIPTKPTCLPLSPSSASPSKSHQLANAARSASSTPSPPPIPPRNYSPMLADDDDKPPPVRKRSSSIRPANGKAALANGTDAIGVSASAPKTVNGVSDDRTPPGELTLPLQKDRCWEFRPTADNGNSFLSWMRLDKNAMDELNVAVQWRHVEVAFVVQGTMYTANLPKMVVRIGDTAEEYLLRCVNDTVGSGAWYKGDPEGDIRTESLERCLELEERLLNSIGSESPSRENASLRLTLEETREQNLIRVPPLVTDGLRIISAPLITSLLENVRKAQSARNVMASLTSPGAKPHSPKQSENAVCSLLDLAKNRRWSCTMDGQEQDLSAGGCEVLNIAVQRRSLGISLVSGGYKKYFDIPHMTMLFEEKYRANLLCTGDVVGAGAWYIERDGHTTAVDAPTCALLDHSICLDTETVEGTQHGHSMVYKLDKMTAVNSDTGKEYVLLRAPTVECLKVSLNKMSRKSRPPENDRNSTIAPSPVKSTLVPAGAAGHQMPPLPPPPVTVTHDGEENMTDSDAKENPYATLPSSYDPTKSMLGKLDMESQLAMSSQTADGRASPSNKHRALDKYHSNERLKHSGKKRWVKLVGNKWVPMAQNESAVMTEAFIRRQSEAFFWTKCPVRGQVLCRIDLPRMQMRENSNSSTNTLIRCEDEDQYGCGVWYFKTTAGFFLALNVQLCESLDAAITPAMVSHRVSLCIDNTPHEFDLFQMSMLDQGMSTSYELRRTPPLSSRQRYDIASATTSSLLPSLEQSNCGPGPGPWENRGIRYPPAWERQHEDVELKDVTSGSSEFTKVINAVQYTLPNATVDQVKRVQHVWQWERYWRERDRILRRSGCTGERLLFHGTSKTPVERICHSEDGLDIRFSAHGMWGQGNYFAVDASYSNNYAHISRDGKRQIFLCLVLTGIAADIAPDGRLRRPPVRIPSGPGQPVEQLHDSVTGVTQGSIIYVTYANDKAYPLYLINYKLTKK